MDCYDEVEEKYQFITDNINDIISVLNEKFELLFINEAQERISGFSKKEIIGKSPLEFLHPDDIKSARKSLRKALKQGQGRGQYRMRSKDNSYKWMDVNGRITFDSDGKQRILLVCRDITREKEIEQKLKESEEKYRLIYENANDLIKVLNNKFEYEELNESVHKRVLGFSKEELLYKTPIAFVHPEDRKRSAILLSKILRKGKGSFQARFKHKDDTIKWLEISAKNYIDSAGNKKIITVGRDFTERKIAEQKLVESEQNLMKKNEELNQLNNLKTELFRSVSHELKTPLNVIKGNVKLIMDLHKEKLKPEIINMMEDIQIGCERLQDRINKIIENSKLETSKIDLHKEKKNLVSIILRCLNDVQSLIKMRNLKVNLGIKTRIITKFDSDQIYEVISNLLSNAINYSLQNGTIDINSKIKGKMITISIKDRGIGLTENEKKEIFQIFGKINRVDQGFDLILEGSGLGLYISKKIVELHGGEIWAESEGRNKGSTFYFTLPII